ncbi:MAG: dihydroorotate dehydrogenase electron transfer subunit [Lachnospiraceae bacterium]|nr:dihydroorotate dehydrogenase electron transfer subunit [Lachnospiraceae bacterium]
MNEMIRKKAKIREKTYLAPDIYRYSFLTDLCSGAEPGQFVMIYPVNGARLLGRPLCIADVSGEDNDSGRADDPGHYFDIVFRVVGGGTEEISGYNPGDELYIEGPLGHGYPFDEKTIGGKNIVMLGGGLGAPSLLFLAKKLMKAPSAFVSLTAVLGYRDRSMNHFLASDFGGTGIKTIISTDDGSEGIRGNVIDALEESGIKADLIYACGPLPMLSAVKRYAKEAGATAYISLEERMACGLGVCLGCVAKTTEKDAHSGVKNARVCTEGPVFCAETVDI